MDLPTMPAIISARPVTPSSTHTMIALKLLNHNATIPTIETRIPSAPAKAAYPVSAGTFP